MILLVHSTRDIAGVNIAKNLLQLYPFAKTKQTYQENPVYAAEMNGKQISFITLKEEAINAQNLQEDFPSAQLDSVHFTSQQPKRNPHAIRSYPGKLWGSRTRRVAKNSLSFTCNSHA